MSKKNIVDLVKKSIFELHSKKKTFIRQNIKDSNITAGIIKNLLKISIESSIEDVKKVKETKEEFSESFPIKEEKEDNISGGYGTVTKSTGYNTSVSYTNYDKIWSNIGSFKSKSMYEDPNKSGFGTQATESTGQMVDTETIEKASKHFKYFVRGDVVGDFGFVPPTGMGIDSKEWEKYRLMSMMSIYRSLLAMKRTTA